MSLNFVFDLNLWWRLNIWWSVYMATWLLWSVNPSCIDNCSRLICDRSNLSSRILWNLFFCSLVEHRMKFWILLELLSINFSDSKLMFLLNMVFGEQFVSITFWGLKNGFPNSMILCSNICFINNSPFVNKYLGSRCLVLVSSVNLFADFW